MTTLNAMLFTPSSPVRWETEELLREHGGLQAVGNYHAGYPTEKEMEVLFRIHSPSVLFVDLADLGAAMEVMAEAKRRLRGIQIIAIAKKPTSETILAVMRAGAIDVLNLPLRGPDFHRAMQKAVQELDGTPVVVDQATKVCAFLPAKAGVGASTVCLNVAYELAQLGRGRTLLMDLDLDCGSVDFLLNLEAGFTARDAAEYGEHMDDTIWNRLMTKFGKLDVLRAGLPQPERPLGTGRITPLVQYARPHYEAVCCDLAPVGNPVSLEVATLANHIFLVTTPEVCALHLALRGLEILSKSGLRDRVQVIVNREDSRSEMRTAQIETLLDTKVALSIPNDWVGLQRNLATGTSLLGSGPLAGKYQQLAKSLHENKPVIGETPAGLLGSLKRFWKSA